MWFSSHGWVASLDGTATSAPQDEGDRGAASQAWYKAETAWFHPKVRRPIAVGMF